MNILKGSWVRKPAQSKLSLLLNFCEIKNKS